MSAVRTIDPHKITTNELHGILLGTVIPRPIAFASTVDNKGHVNLSPFSFFNVFSANPPIMIFSPARRVRDNTTKHTLDNVHAIKEVVINTVSYEMVQQMSLTSTEYDKGVNEFSKSGFTEEASVLVAPPRVKEALASFECKVNEIMPLGTEGGAGNLVICEVLLIHLSPDILSPDNKIDPYKMSAIARLGGNWYSKVTVDSIFEVGKPNVSKGIGVDNLPEHARNSSILSGNDLGILGNLSSLPDKGLVDEVKKRDEVLALLKKYPDKKDGFQNGIHTLCKLYIKKNQVCDALALLFMKLS